MKNKSKTAVEKAAPTKAVEVPRDAEVQTKTEVAQAAYLANIGRQIIEKTGELGSLYLSLCLEIRKQKIAPKLVSFELTRLGFKRSRISEINRVANASDKTFKDFEARLIGFGKAIELSRAEKPGDVPQLTDAAKILVDEEALTQEDVDAMQAAETAPSPTAKPKAVTMKAVAKKLASMATREKHIFAFKDVPYRVTVERLGKTGPAVGDDEKE